MAGGPMLTVTQTREHRRIELQALVCLFQQERVCRYLEIGARSGSSFDTIMRALPRGSQGTAVDCPGAVWGVSGSARALRDTIARLNGDGYDCAAIFGASQDERVIRHVDARGPYDAVFIDADHRYEAVAADWRAYRTRARIVAFHDIAGVGVVSAHGLPVEVPRLWDEIKGQYQSVDLVVPDSILGIGVVYL